MLALRQDADIARLRPEDWLANLIIAGTVNEEVKKELMTIDNPAIRSEWRLTVIAATVRIALVDILDLSEVSIPAGGFLYPAVGWG